MPKRTVPGTDVGYHLVLFDEDGHERPEADGSMQSDAVLEDVANATDVFVTSHGWKGDIPAAIRQYDAWVGAMAGQENDRRLVRQVDPDFRAVVVGVHWPSLPWGVEEVGAALLGPDEAGTDEAGPDGLAAEDALDAAELVDRYAARLGDDPSVRAALETVVAAAEDPAAVAALEAGTVPPELAAAYDTLYRSSSLGRDGALGAPGADQPGFEPALVVEQWGAGPAAGPSATATGGPVGGPTSAPGGLLGWDDDLVARLRRAREVVLAPVRQLSFWTMKRRARVVGETGVHDLLAAIQAAAPQDEDGQPRQRVHLMGHSFGCIVMSAAVAGPAVDGRFPSPLPRPVDAMLLVQGAMSLWSYAEKVPFLPGRTGFYEPVLDAPARVRGPLVTTRSSYDTAVGRYYPLGVRVTGDVLLGEELPEYGAIGAFGIQGTTVEDRPILHADAAYGLQPGVVVNVDAERVIRNGTGPSGAHSDIVHPEVAHLMWQAVVAAAG